MNSKNIQAYIKSRDLKLAVSKAQEKLAEYMTTATDEASRFAAQNAINALHDFELVRSKAKSNDGRDF